MQKTDSPLAFGDEARSGPRLTEPTGNETGGWLTVIEPIEYTGLKGDLTESFLPKTLYV